MTRAGGCDDGLSIFRASGVRLTGGLALALATLTAASASARDVGFPETKPTITMTVPDGWDVHYSPFGLEIVSPEKNLYIVADLLPRKKAEADAWAIKAEEKLEGFGVAFGPAKPVVASKAAPDGAKPASAKLESAKSESARSESAKSEPVKSEPAEAAVAGTRSATTEPTRPEAAELQAAKPDSNTPEVAKTDKIAPAQPERAPGGMVASAAVPGGDAGSVPPRPGVSFAPTGTLDMSAPTFTFMNPPKKIVPPEAPAPAPAAAYFGSPSLETPNQSQAPTAVRTDGPRAATMEELTRATVVRPKIPFAVGRLPRATLDGKPVDVQIVNFAVNPRQLFMVLQASGPTDQRAVEIIESVKPAG